jgi:hypothetical protein
MLEAADLRNGDDGADRRFDGFRMGDNPSAFTTIT